MAIKTAPSATPLGMREPALIAFVVAAVVANVTIALVIEKWGNIEWLDAVYGGFFVGQCLAAIMLAGLMGRSWLGAYAVVLGIVALCFSAMMFPEWWRHGATYPDLFLIPCMAPLPLLIASAPSMALRQLVGLRMAIVSRVPWSRRQLSIGDIFIAVAFTAALLVLARVGMLSLRQDRADFWAGESMLSLTGLVMGTLIVLPAVWCIFVIKSRRVMLLVLGGLLLLPSAIFSCIVPFISAEMLSLEEKIQGLGYCALISAAAFVNFVPPLLLFYGRGYRLLRVPFSGAVDEPVRYRHASRWIVGALVAVAAIVNFYIAPIEESQERERQFGRWARSLGTAKEEVDQRWDLDFANASLDDDDLQLLGNVSSVVRLDLSGTDITDAGLEYVGQLTSLEILKLNDTEVTDHGLQYLRHLPKLRSLSLQNTGVSGSAFVEFASRNNIRAVNLHGAPVTDEGCRGIGELKALRELNLSDTSITDDGLSQLGGLTRLQSLDLRDTVFDGNGFANFSEMPELRIVYLSGSRCGDGVSHLVLRSPRLGVLLLDGTKVTDTLMSALQGSSIIYELELSGTSVTDDGLKTLGSLPNLSSISLDGTSVTGAGFRDLNARKLVQLSLQATPISDDSLAHLKRYPRLRSLNLSDTPIGDDALSHLAGKWFEEVNVATTQVTAKGLLSAHFDAGELTIDDQQADDGELAALAEMYESLNVVPKNSELQSE